MKILYAINSAKRGGAEVHVLDLVSGLVALGHKIYVWCPEGEMAKEYRNAGANVTTYEIKMDFDIKYIFALRNFLQINNIDVVHAHELKAVGNAIFAGYLAGTKVRISHSHTPISEWKISPFKKFLNSKIFYNTFVNLFSTKEIALTESRKVVKRNEGISESKITVIPNGIDVSRYTITELKRLDYRYEILCKYDLDEDSYIFGNIGRLSIEKGLIDLVEAFALFVRHPQINASHVYLMLIGHGEEYSKIRERVLALGIEKHVIMPNVVFEESDKIKYLSAFDCFVFPSHAEGFGLVLLEAMSMSIPTICSDLSVLQEVGGSSVIFFEMGNSQNLSEKMFNVYSKREIFDEVKEDERKRVEDLFTMDAFIANYEKLYLELLGVTI